MYRFIVIVAASLPIASIANGALEEGTVGASFKSPASSMHFTRGQPIVVFADLGDRRHTHGFIACPDGTEAHKPAGGGQTYCDSGEPEGWPQFQVLLKIGGEFQAQRDIDADSLIVKGSTKVNSNGNPDPIGFFRFKFSTAAHPAGAYEMKLRGLYSDGTHEDSLESSSITVFIDDAPSDKEVIELDSNVTGEVTWINKIIVGHNFTVNPNSNKITIKNCLVTGLGAMTTPGIAGTASAVDIQGSTFEDNGGIELTLGSGDVVFNNNELRANNRLKFVASDPEAGTIIRFDGGSSPNRKLFQGNRIGGGRVEFDSSSLWLVGGDSDDQSNIMIGPRAVFAFYSGTTNMIVRGNYVHHNYRGGWSQGFNFHYGIGNTSGDNILAEHNFIWGSSWPLQTLAGEFRYNVVFEVGHTWIRYNAPDAIIHHNLFIPPYNGELDAGFQCSNGGLQIYNNTFDGGGSNTGNFSNPTIACGGSSVTTFRNNLVTFSRNASDGPGTARITGSGFAAATTDYNAFYSPDNSNKANYGFSNGAGAHDAEDTGDGQLAASPFTSVDSGTNRYFEDFAEPDEDPWEGQVWERTKKLSQLLAFFRNRYTPKASSSVVNAGDPDDNDSLGRRTDIGAIDRDGHDDDKLGKWSGGPTETTPPTVTLTAPTGGLTIAAGSFTLAADAADDSGIANVKFLVDGNVVGQDTSAPYQFTLITANIGAGSHTFTAEAWDANNNHAISAPVTAQIAVDTTAPAAPTGVRIQ